jgi:sirohydrochlorin cobaltochelatase
MRHRLILLAHGSPDPNWRRPFIELSRDLQARLGDGAVRLAFMEFAAPTLRDVFREAARDGRTSLSVLPLFLAAGAHLSADIPKQIAEAEKERAELRIELLAPIAEDRRVQALFREIACEHWSRAR